jgi:hypothetical protein
LTARTGENIAVKEAEQVTKRVGSEEATRLLSRILSRTFLVKLVPIINALPLWTISTVLLLRRNKKDQREQAEAKQNQLAETETETRRYRQAIQQLTIDSQDA